MATDIQKRRVIVFPLVTGPDYRGNADDDTVPFDAVPLSVQYLRDRGAAPLRNGETWGLRLALKYYDEDGLQTAVSLSGASNAVMYVWHKTTGDYVDKRTQDVVITGAIKELAIDGDGTAGTITVYWHEDETITSGHHHWAILADWTYAEPVAAGTIDVLPAIPTS